MIKLKNVKKSFELKNKKIAVLKDINLELEEGKTLSIVGPSGSGKTTLLSLLSGLDRPSDGSISIAGKDINNMNDEELTKFRGQNIGIVFQSFHLIPYLTAKENIEIATDLESKPSNALDWLSSVGLADRADHYPHQLSGGECQRLAIARALAVKPKIIIADEPSGNLDRETGKMVMDILFKLAKENKSTLILVSHDEYYAKQTDESKKLEAGSLIALS